MGTEYPGRKQSPNLADQSAVSQAENIYPILNPDFLLGFWHKMRLSRFRNAVYAYATTVSYIRGKYKRMKGKGKGKEIMSEEDSVQTSIAYSLKLRLRNY